MILFCIPPLHIVLGIRHREEGREAGKEWEGREENREETPVRYMCICFGLCNFIALLKH